MDNVHDKSPNVPEGTLDGSTFGNNPRDATKVVDKDVLQPTLKTRKRKRKKNRRNLFNRRKDKRRRKDALNLPESSSTNLPRFAIDDPEHFEIVMPGEDRFHFLDELERLPSEAAKESLAANEAFLSPELPQEVSYRSHQLEATISTNEESSTGCNLGRGDDCSTPSFIPSDNDYSAKESPSSSGPNLAGYILDDEDDYSPLPQVPEGVLQSPGNRSVSTSEGQCFIDVKHHINEALSFGGVKTIFCEHNMNEMPLHLVSNALELFKGLLPKPWSIMTHHSSFDAFYVSSQFPRAIQREVSLMWDGTIKIAVHGEPLIFADNLVQSTAPSPVEFNEKSIQDFCVRGVSVVKKIMQYNVCVGANMVGFENVWESYPNCYLDKNYYKEDSYTITCRSMSCPKLVLRDFGRIRCKFCNTLMKHLKSRLKFACSDTVHPTTPNAFLTHKQALRKLERQHNETRKKDRQIDYLRKKIEKLIENKGVDLDETTSTDVEEILIQSCLLSRE